jgi:hypothetical protein
VLCVCVCVHTGALARTHTRARTQRYTAALRGSATDSAQSSHVKKSLAQILKSQCPDIINYVSHYIEDL